MSWYHVHFVRFGYKLEFYGEVDISNSSVLYSIFYQQYKRLLDLEINLPLYWKSEEDDNYGKEDGIQEESIPATCPHCAKHKERSEKEYKDLINRLSRIEGQIRGIKGMVENDCYCTDILIQVSAVTSALNGFNKVLLANHIKTCVAQDIRDGKEEAIDELVVTLQKLMK